MKNSEITTYVCFPKTLKYLTQALQFELLSQGGLLSCSFLFLVKSERQICTRTRSAASRVQEPNFLE